MRRMKYVLQFTVALGLFSATLPAQRGGAVAHGATLPSSTAIGAGALSTHPSSTAASTRPSFAGKGYGLGYGRYGYGYGRGYRNLPRSYVVAPYYYPFFDWSGGTDYSNQAPPPDDSAGYGPDPVTEQLLANEAALGQQVQRLTAQVDSLTYGQGGYPPTEAQTQPQTPPAPPVTLVLRNGQTMQVENYAVTGNTFWDFSQHGTHKIPLSNIDLAASAKATEANGGEFPQIDQTK